MKTDKLILYHGSPKAIDKPIYGFGDVHNVDADGFANQYSLSLSGLSTLDLSSSGMNVLNWLAILLANREFSVLPGLPETAKAYILDSFLPEYQQFDVIRGYRADDSYFSFAKAFLNGTLSLEQLSRAMRLGNLGEQIVLKSKLAFDALEFERAAPCSAIVWNTRRRKRDDQAREDYRRMAAETPMEGAVYVVDVLREKWKNDDTRLR